MHSPQDSSDPGLRSQTRHERRSPETVAKRAALCAVEGLLMAGRALKDHSVASVLDIINAVQAYVDTTTSSKSLVQPIVRFHALAEPIEGSIEILDCGLAAMKTLNSQDSVNLSDVFPQPYLDGPELVLPPFDLPSVLAPPEVVEMDTFGESSSEEAQVRREEWPEYHLMQVSSKLTHIVSSVGYALKSTLLDIIDIYDVNRKECARILIEFPKWTPPGTFRSKPNPPPGIQIPDPVPGKDWQLENAVVDNILGSMYALPDSRQRSMYYIALITELCKLSSSTVGPAVGKSIRRLYGLLGDGLDTEVGHRFAEWFSVHMSNLNSQWVWKEWIPDLQLSSQNPRRSFMRKTVECEIRLAYYDRIARTLPEDLQDPEAQIVPDQPPGPDYEYDDPAHPYHDAAQSVLGLLRGRSKAEDVMSSLESLRNSLADVLRSIAIQSLLHTGSRSFSHFLNAVERYLPLLRNLAAGGISSSGGTPSLEARMDILTASARFWKRNRQMVGIVFDKLMQYQIVDPTDVASWTFGSGLGNGKGPLKVDHRQWDLLKGALDKANGRVMIARRRVIALRKEDENRARANANGASNGASMEVDADAKPDDHVESPALTTAVKAFDSLTREQKSVLSRILDGFAACLVPFPSEPNKSEYAREVVQENNAWETWGWYRHFCGSYSAYSRMFSTTLGTVLLTRIEGSTDPTAVLVKKIWNAAIRAEEA
ncbi:hypothetical protein BDM02DRAFT_3181735 [Thelephora ganbajun]|uniref:Uncharacterized protein n=1 Tax=Thelephora ganbajun TaxID=370292 RepID=A0ACB6Z391_THEGA|nr:hypothetical protein BDM02DRAFT_3181735 [Thelephora ganbajun]